MSNPLSEIVLISQDVPRMTAFYRDIFAFEFDTEPSEDWTWFLLASEEGDAASAVRLAITTGPLLYQANSPRPETANAPRGGWGPIHFAFKFTHEQAEEVMQRAKDAGHTVHGPQYFERMQATSYYIYDPDGNLPEMWIPDPPTPPTNDHGHELHSAD